MGTNYTHDVVHASPAGPMGDENCEEEECGGLEEGTEQWKRCVCRDCPDYKCIVLDGALVLEYDPDGPAGVRASVFELNHAFFYNIRDAEGNLIDTVAGPVGLAGTGIRFVMSRRPGFDTGVAIFVTVPQPVNIRVYLPGGAAPAGTTVLDGVNPLTVFRDDFFLNDFVDGLPDVIDSAVVEMTVEIGEIYGMALGVKVEDGNVQLSGQNVTPFGLEGGAPFDAQ